MNKNTGFSLIELMVVIAIIAILAGIAVPSFIAQINHTRIDDAQSALIQAVGRARAIALRNEVGNFEGKQSTVVCFDSSTTAISLHGAVRNVAGTLVDANCTDNQIWIHNTLHSDIRIYTVTYDALRDEKAFLQIAFDNKGRIVIGCPTGILCAQNNLFLVKLNGTSYQSDEKVIY
ncbi:prepilin-type N-terminal cleavage/methylation domain-containing protein [Marinicellulosiphila megalodicopiae]|uniref:prepilin-type N-terminal cleavage/methylation domain-containing protein n=1 Tax=Marinicellulosiphila megalodicopiae TaxID=2724896 RepID=UPI003BAF97BB